MVNNLLTLIFFPELILTFGILFILVFAFFIKKNVFDTISNLSIILLLIVLFSIIKNADISFAFYKIFFKSSLFIADITYKDKLCNSIPKYIDIKLFEEIRTSIPKVENNISIGISNLNSFKSKK